ncbi:TetR/AcrR family transcriptional regulator [Yinghuangia seranimata]|uniref:TetR/AcrR family transcriptional regulator n=1 Tax=Yinghuangia seranimata TaxID=408067 RepID=UPI00248B88BC|nr:TetR/AcrR family transcriptional regulator [Yinghuangia seranimata]MDI2129252.1 TetR/AcrR family transcriptional regulator [Yinghuangia seranimata]
MADDQESMWERLARPAKAPRTTLTHAAIAAAALEMADSEGLDAVSMRKLAGYLGVTTMALYRYVTSKDELFELMIDAAFAERSAPATAPADWRDAMRAHARQAREIALRHPWLGELAARQVVVITPNVVAAIERDLATLEGLGLDVDTAMAVHHAVTSYVRGAVAAEVAQRELMKRQNWSGGDDLRDAYGPAMNWMMGTGNYPAYQRYVSKARRKDDHEWRFEFGLDCVLDGVAARVGG